MANSKPNFEEALAELEKLVEEIESGRIGLEESIARYEKGIKLIKQCRTILDAAEKRIQLLAKAEGGELTASGELEESSQEPAGQ
jgi:exodeoxyribonuclease VII small subunit